MASSRSHREAGSVRRYLELLPDVGNVRRPGDKSVDSVAGDLNIDADKLRAFRDGNDNSLDRATVALFARLLGRDDAGMLGSSLPDDSLGYADLSSNGWYRAMMAEETQRQARLRTYQLIDRTRGEAHAATHAWADLAITGSIGEIERHAGGFEPIVYSKAKAMKDLMKSLAVQINQNVLPDDQKLLAHRGMMKYGDQWAELGLGVRNGRRYLDRLFPRHARSMFHHREEDGSYNAARAYKQIMPGDTTPTAYFPEWKILHFANLDGWGDLYGESLFASGLRAYIQIEAMEAAMIIRRLERASLRYKHIVDVGLIDGGDESIRRHLDKMRDIYKKVRVVDQSRNMRNQRINMPADYDFFVARRDKESVSDVEVLDGDGNIGELADVMHHFNKWLAVLGPPKAHLGYEDEGSKTGVNDKHIVFARKVRRTQLHFIRGLNHLYWVGLILQGIDPRTVRYTIFPPSLGTRDELIRAQVQLAHATTVQYLAKGFGLSGQIPSINWFLKYIMGMDDDVLDDLDLKDVVQQAQGAGFKNDPPANMPERNDAVAMAEAAQTSPDVLGRIEQLQFLMDERAIAMRKKEAAPRLAAPFTHQFEDVVRSLGVTELRSG